MVTWSDNTPGVDGPDVLKFIFNRNNAGGTIAASFDGLEAARFLPAANGNEVFFGVGDWLSYVGQQPNERLHVLDRTIRLNNFMDPLPGYLTTTYENTELNRVVVVDPTDGRLYWRSIGGIFSCDWALDANNHVVTAYTGHLCPPQQEHGVAIGVSSPKAKLHVQHTDYSLLQRQATLGTILCDDVTSDYVAIHGYASPTGIPVNGRDVIGVVGESHDARLTTGVRGVGFMNAVGYSAGQVYGVHGHAFLANGATSRHTAGVMGTVDSN